MKNDLLVDVKPGDPIVASQQNEVLRTIRQYQGLGDTFVSGGLVLTRPSLGSQAGATLEWAMVVGDIPAFTAIDGTAFTATPGMSSAEDVHLMQWDVSNLKADDDDTTYRGVNGSGTDLRASIAEPVLVRGTIEDVDGKDIFSIVSIMDFRCLPGFVEGVVGTDTDMQIPFHDGGAGDFKLSSEAC